jgi:hypothetical protein
MLPVAPDALPQLDADAGTFHGFLPRGGVRARRGQTTRNSMRLAAISIAFLVAAVVVATFRSIANSSASAPAGDTSAANGSILNGSEEAHANDLPTQAVIASTIPSRRNRSSCPECGVVESIRQLGRSGGSDAMGAANAVVDRGRLGSEAGGAVATHAATGPDYEIRVRFRDGSSTAITQASPQGWRLGSQVIVVSRSPTPINQ